ncbi:MAG TPA: hypothetical protein VMB48_13645 [Steroidobacteraceae bacterium]|nr:hypothetical protein [Steroidobacteraceae bacterium]
MRLAGNNFTNGRQERLDRRRRDRAAALTLRVAYPGVELLRVELHFRGTPYAPALQSHELHPAARAYFEFPCPYADCDGSFDLNQAVKAALSQGRHRAEGVLECPGARARDHASQRPCGLQLVYQISALYQRDA